MKLDRGWPPVGEVDSDASVHRPRSTERSLNQSEDDFESVSCEPQGDAVSLCGGRVDAAERRPTTKGLTAACACATAKPNHVRLWGLCSDPLLEGAPPMFKLILAHPCGSSHAEVDDLDDVDINA